MKNYKITVRNFHSHETNDFTIQEESAQLAHKKGLSKTNALFEDISEIHNEEGIRVYHILKGWNE